MPSRERAKFSPALRERVGAGDSPQPDDNPPYKSIIALPLFTNTEVTQFERSNLMIEPVQRFIGILYDRFKGNR